MDRLHMNLITSASQALNRLCETTGLNRTDVVNRALQLYSLVDDAQRSGATVALKRPDGSIDLVHFLS